MQSVPQDGPTYLDLLHVLVPLPESGAQFRTLATDAKMSAVVLLAPGDGLSNAHRRMAEAWTNCETSRTSYRLKWQADQVTRRSSTCNQCHFVTSKRLMRLHSHRRRASLHPSSARLSEPAGRDGECDGRTFRLRSLIELRF